MVSRRSPHVSGVTCHVSRVTCHVSRVTCHMSHVTCHMSHVTSHFVFFFFSSFSFQIGEARRGRVCYQPGLPRLVTTPQRLQTMVDVCSSPVIWNHGWVTWSFIIFLFYKLARITKYKPFISNKFNIILFAD